VGGGTERRAKEEKEGSGRMRIGYFQHKIKHEMQFRADADREEFGDLVLFCDRDESVVIDIRVSANSDEKALELLKLIREKLSGIGKMVSAEEFLKEGIKVFDMLDKEVIRDEYRRYLRALELDGDSKRINNGLTSVLEFEEAKH